MTKNREWLTQDKDRAEEWLMSIQELNIPGWTYSSVKDCMGGYTVYIHNKTKDMFIAGSFGVDGDTEIQDYIACWDYNDSTMKSIGTFHESACGYGQNRSFTKCPKCNL